MQCGYKDIYVYIHTHTERERESEREREREILTAKGIAALNAEGNAEDTAGGSPKGAAKSNPDTGFGFRVESKGTYIYIYIYACIYIYIHMDCF